MLPNVPRTITRSFPRRDPKLLKSRISTLFSCKYFPAGPSDAIAPAGEMWSVVTESLSSANTRAPLMGATSGTVPSLTLSKNGGW